MAEKTSQQPAAQTKTETTQSSDTENWIKRNVPDSVAVQNPWLRESIDELARQAAKDTTLVSDDPVGMVEELIAGLDKKLDEQVNLILHAPKFQALEGSWRGLNSLVMKSDLDSKLKIRVLNVSKEEIRKSFKRYPGERWAESPLFLKIYQKEYGTPGGEPYGCIIGDFEFSEAPTDIEVLTGMAQIAAMAHAPFITAAAPALLGLNSWSELPNVKDATKLFDLAKYTGWRALRAHEDSRYIGMAFPRFMSRKPYGAKSEPVDEFAFEEDLAHGDPNRYTWSNAAYAMGLNIARSFSDYGWTCNIRGANAGGRVDGLPVALFETDDGGQDLVCPTEVSITESQELNLANNGFMPLSHFKNTDYAAFIGAQSLQKPKEYSGDKDATANARISARLPYLFASCRFSHFLKKMVYYMIGKNMERADIEKELNRWIMTYVLGDPQNASEAQKAEKPLRDARVEVVEIEDDPGYYTARFYLRPHFQLEGIDVSMRLVAKMPSSKKS
jgi:type VI secretion system protein ImpC